MTMVLAFVLLGLIIIVWIYGVYLSWKQNEGVVFEPIERSVFVTRWAHLIRLFRRGWYGARVEGKHLLSWSGKQAENAFVTVFPKSAAAFTKHNQLTGLQQGPSSYFLKSISVPKPRAEKRLPKTKKVV